MSIKYWAVDSTEMNVSWSGYPTEQDARDIAPLLCTPETIDTIRRPSNELARSAELEIGALTRRAESAEAEVLRLIEALRYIVATCERFGGRSAVAQEVREIARQGFKQCERTNGSLTAASSHTERTDT